MRIPRLISLLALLLGLAACGDATGSGHLISGVWQRLEADAGASASREYLVFEPYGRFARDVGGGHADGGDPPLFYYREEGEYRVRSDRLELRLTHRMDWSLQDGGPPRVTTLPGEWEDAGTVTVAGETMVRTYVADSGGGPEETRVVYQRATAERLD
jgi:hypothetical protein